MQENPDIKWKDLQKIVIDSIFKGVHIDFTDHEIEECRYMQKVADIYLSIYGIILTLSTFIFAIGVTYIIAFLPLKNNLFVIIGFGICVLGVLLAMCWTKIISIFRNYINITLNAEEKIQSSNYKQRKAETIEENI